jgi:hypothetical protein
MVSLSSPSGIHPLQLPTGPVQTPATNSSAVKPLPVAFPADSAPRVARGVPSKVCIGNLSFRVGAMRGPLRSGERESVQAALNNIVPGQTPELDENRMFSYQAYSDPQKNPGKMVVSGELDNNNNLLSLTAMHVHPDALPAATESPVFEPVRFAPPRNALHKLPNETLMTIAGYSSDSSLRALRGVNQHLKAIAQTKTSAPQNFIFANGAALQAMGFRAFYMQKLAECPAAEQAFVLARGAALLAARSAAE